MGINSNFKIEAQELLSFIKDCPTAYHTVANIESQLLANGFQRLWENESWDLQAGGKYFVSRNGSSCLAFILPEDMSAATGYRIVAVHNDSPAFKLKDTFDRPSAGYCRLNVEKYGGMLCSTWMDRPLSVAGRVLISNEKGVESRLINFDRNCAMIPNVAIHMDRSANDGKSYNPQVDMLPVVGLQDGDEGFLTQLLQEIGVEKEQLLAHDLFLYCREEGYLWGKREEMISAPRLDDLMCVFSALKAFLMSPVTSVSHISVFAAFDNEEVGSSTLQGAASSLLEDTISRIEVFPGNGQVSPGYHTRLAGSLMLSADNAHAIHPNHPEYADGQNFPTIGGGVVIKFNAQQRYATDAVGAALFRRLCASEGVKLQTYANRSDIPGGSTLGNIASARIPIRTVDIGLAQLAMHSAFETAGGEDIVEMIRACRAFYHTEITFHQGVYEVKE